ncbi:transposase [Streptomyces sp. NPDC000075]|uniref:transposase n=1 Tax=Streptomyces sp. NPDC000075 TaxID=3154241 RepID=UPI00331CE67D
MPRTGPGRPRKRHGHVIGDKGYRSKAIRTRIRRRGIAHTIPERPDQVRYRPRRGTRGGRPPVFDQQVYERRNVLERCFNRLKQWRGITTGYDTLVLSRRRSGGPAESRTRNVLCRCEPEELRMGKLGSDVSAPVSVAVTLARAPGPRSGPLPGRHRHPAPEVYQACARYIPDITVLATARSSAGQITGGRRRGASDCHLECQHRRASTPGRTRRARRHCR